MSDAGMNGHFLGNQRVLIVEDEYLIAQDIREMVLAFGGQPVGPVPSLNAARELSAGQPVELALVDYNLRDEAAMPLVEALLDEGVATVIVTGYDRDSLPARFADMPIVSKPVAMSSLKAAIVRAIGIARDRRAPGGK